MTLNQLPYGETAEIVSINAAMPLRQRLLEMGLTPRTRVEKIKAAPLGDPVELYLRGYALTMRLEDLERVKISVTDDENIFSP